MVKTLNQIKEEYEFELDRVVGEIKKGGAGSVLLQFPDGLKVYAMEIADFIERETSADVRIWFGSCFGACDVPKTDAGLVVQFGHAPWL